MSIVVSHTSNLIQNNHWDRIPSYIVACHYLYYERIYYLEYKLNFENLINHHNADGFIQIQINAFFWNIYDNYKNKCI